MIGASAVRRRYYGDKAHGYEARRAHRPFWAAENAAVESMLLELEPGSKVLDVPVGTARYAPIYRRLDFQALGIDISPDMLQEAQRRIKQLGMVLDFELRLGDILQLENIGPFDAVVCTRLMNWLLPDEMVRAMEQMARVCTDRLIVSIELGKRLSDRGNNPHWADDFATVVQHIGGRIEREVAIEPNYWMTQINVS